MTMTRTLTGTPHISPFRSIYTTPHPPVYHHHHPPPPIGNSSLDAKDSAQPPAPGGLSEWLRMLMKKYGWYTIGVYFAISVMDFAIAYAGINLLDADYVTSVAASAKAWVLGLVCSRPPEPCRAELEDVWGNVSRQGQEGLYAMLVLAYTVHKTLFLPIWIGFTAAFMPKIMNWLHAQGWAGGEVTRRAMNEMKEWLKNCD